MSKDDTNLWDACRRAYASASRLKEATSASAARLGWDFVSGLFVPDNFESQYHRIMELKFGMSNDADLFNDEGVIPLVHENFYDINGNSYGISGLEKDPDRDALGRFLKEFIASIDEFQKGLGVRSFGIAEARSAFLGASQLFIEGRSSEALQLLELARRTADSERGRYVDLRHRNKVVEGLPELYVNLGLVYLQYKRYDEAFETFESVRAAGLSELAAAFEARPFSVAERVWLSRMVDVGSRESVLLNGIVGEAIAGLENPDLNENLDELERVRAEREALLADPVASFVTEAVAAAERDPVSLSDLRAAVAESGIPVIMYWTTFTNTIVWAISPGDMEVKAVFLPDFAVLDKVERVTESARTPEAPFDTEAARQLYAYLIQPFEPSECERGGNRPTRILGLPAFRDADRPADRRVSG